MRLLVRPLRIRGRRLPWRNVQNGPAYEGDLVVTYEAMGKNGRTVAATLAGRDPTSAKPLPDVYEPVLVSVAPSALRLRGFGATMGRTVPTALPRSGIAIDLTNNKPATRAGLCTGTLRS